MVDRDRARTVGCVEPEDRDLEREALFRRKTHSPFRFLTSLVSLDFAAGRNELERDRARRVDLEELRDFLEEELVLNSYAGL